MVVYITDPSHSPQQWQEEYREGPAYGAAVKVVQADKENAEIVGYRQSTISETQRLYLRTNNRTGNSWEVKLDDDANEIPAPCATTPGGDPRNFTYSLTNVTIAGQYSQVSDGTQLQVTITGLLPQA
jgi:hypothetical protein